MVNYTSSNGVEKIMDDLNLHPSAEVKDTLPEDDNDQMLTNERLEEREYQRAPDYDEEEPVEEADYYEKDEVYGADDNSNDIPDTEEVGTYREEDNVPDEFEERAEESDLYGVSQETQQEAKQMNKSSNKSALSGIGDKAKKVASATAGFIGGFSVAKASSKKGSGGIAVTHKSKGKKAKTIEFGVRQPVSFPKMPTAPSPYGTKRKATKPVRQSKAVPLTTNTTYDPVGISEMGNGFQENPFYGGNYRVSTFNFGISPQPVKSKKQPVKRAKEQTAESIFGIGSSPQSTSDIFGFSFGVEKPKKSTKTTKKSKKTTKKSVKSKKTVQKQSKNNEFESLFGFKL